MENIDTTIIEVEGYGPRSLPVGPQIINLNSQYIGQFPMSSPGSPDKVGRKTDGMVLAKPDSERWWSTKPYVPPLH
jgi:hypothetical protein